MIPEGVYRRALKARAEVIDGNTNDLLWDLNLYRYALQKAVDALWDLDKVPKKSQVHQLLYPVLKSYGFRAHTIRNIYSTALALVKSAKRYKGSKPVIKRMSARLDYQDAKVDVDSHVAKVILRDKWYMLRIVHRREYIEKFKGLRWKEVRLKYVDGMLYVSIVFEVVYKPYTPRGAVAVDMNLRHIVTYNGSSVRRHRTKFVDALSKRARAEELMRKYPKRWRYNEEMLSRVKALHRKARSIAIDWCRKFAKELILKTKRHSYAVVLENLEHLRENIARNGSNAVWKLSMFAYRKLQGAVISKAIEYRVPIVLVNPKNTSTTCPRCGAKLYYIHRFAICKRCKFIADRDSIGAMNIWLRALHAYTGEPGSPQSTPAMNNEARGSRGTKGDGMKKVFRDIRKYRSDPNPIFSH